jgi:tetratricopeptide (TPR) repeat protein
LRSRAKDAEAYDDYLRAKVVARGRGAQALADAEKLLEQSLALDPDFEPANAMIAYDYALTPLFEPSLRGGRPDEERKITDRLIPRAEAFAVRAVALDPKDAGAYVALGYVRLVQRKMLAAEDAFKQALRLDPNQADGLHGYSQFLAAMGKIKESLAMRDHLQAIEPSIVQYTADTAEIYWLTGATDKAIEMLQPFRPGRTLELALIESAAGRYHHAASALREMPSSNWPDDMLVKAAKLLDTAPAQNAPESLPKLGSLGFTYLHVGAPERVLEYYEDEVKGGYFQPISTTWFWHPSYAVVRKTERFKKLARDLGLVEYWRARGWPAACHPMGKDDFECE